MTPFKIISILIILGLTALCYWIAYKNGKKEIGFGVTIIIGFFICLSIFGGLDFFIIFLWPIILVFQLLFIIYWTFKLYGRKKLGTIITIALTCGFLLIALQPWIIDWTFNKKDTREILSWQDIELKNNFEILENESGGFTDYYQTFTLKLSKSDYLRIEDKIRSSDNFLGIVKSAEEFPMADHNSADTINYENDHYLKREYYTKERMEDGTFHFTLLLSKKVKELSYIGSNE